MIQSLLIANRGAIAYRTILILFPAQKKSGMVRGMTKKRSFGTLCS
jgi:hypothetical protein